MRRTIRDRLKAARDGFFRRPAPGPAAPDDDAAWRLLAAAAPDLITRHTPDGRIRLAGGAVRTLLGRDAAALEGLTPPDLVHPGDLALVQAMFRDASYFGRGGVAAARLGHADGRWLWMELRCSRMPLCEGGDVVVVTREIGAFKAQSAALAQARDDALAATQEKSRFLAAMSHELRTPLNAILGFSEVMTLEMFGPLSPRYRDYAGSIQDSGRHLLELINGLLDMSKIEAGKFDLHQEVFDLAQTAQGAARLVALGAERAGLTLEVAVAPEARLAFADARAVKQMLVNLLANAVKFSAPGGHVGLSARTEGKAVILAVADRGVGIAPAELEKLGRPFAQGAAAHGKQGTGLGLALVKALAALHGGEAVIASRLGEGTCVTVRLPHAAVTAAKDNVVPLRGAA